ncbi:MAG: serine/threonine protein kinase [Lachnospiraceae bacterium]|nr:MAG: serine/threonine protein kinase [Lachnospiraceae bacterium]
MLKVGDLIDGKYKILNEIGRGGMSTVYLAINEKANKPWAVKEVRKNGISNRELVKQSLMVEINLLKKLKHKGLPSIVDIIDQQDNYLIVMDYIEGITLENIMQEEGVQPQEKVVDWAIQLCDVLQYLHTRKPAIIYRDMKPSNIMLRSDGSVVLIDFGTAREFNERHVEDTTCLGTQGYAAPEQFGGMGQTDERTDIYSLGATMYRLVTGHNPSEPPYEMYPITHWNPRLSTGLEGIIAKCTSKDPKSRYQSVQEVRYALEHYRDLDLDSIRRYRRNLRILLAAGGMTAMLFGASGVSYAAADHMQKDEYAYNLEAGRRSPNKQDSIAFYQKAIQTDCAGEEAYDQLLTLVTQDGVLDEQEEKVLLQLSISVDKYLERYKMQNPDGYAGLCYRIGSSYWYYYEHEEKRQAGAVAWFESAKAGFEGNPEKEQEWKRASTYVEIGNFYQRIVPAQISGTDQGMYGEYWNNLRRLKEWNDEAPDRDLVTLRLYREIVTKTLEYAGYLQEDGVPPQEMEDLLNEISQQTENMKTGAGQVLMEEIQELEQALKGAQQMLASCKWKGGAS